MSGSPTWTARATSTTRSIRPISRPAASARIYDPELGFQVDGCTTVLARIEIDFLKELHWPGTIEIGTAIAEIRRSSYVFSQAIFSEGDCAARARSTMVLIDRATRKARPLPPELIERLNRILLKT